MLSQRELSSYLNDHYVASAAGVEAFRRVARSHASSDRGPELARLAEEVAQDRGELKAIMRTLGVRELRPLAAVGWAAEKVGRLKPNGSLVHRTGLTDLVELEALRTAVSGQLCGWQVLRALATYDDRLDRVRVETLIEHAEDHAHRLYQLQMTLAQQLLSGGTPATEDGRESA